MAHDVDLPTALLHEVYQALHDALNALAQATWYGEFVANAPELSAQTQEDARTALQGAQQAAELLQALARRLPANPGPSGGTTSSQ